MEKPPFQITLKNIIWAVFWVGTWLATLRLLNPHDLLDDGPDSLNPRLIVSFWIVPAAGVIGAIAGQPNGRLVKGAIVCWLVLALLIGLFTPAIY